MKELLPKISIVLPFFRAGAYLAEAVESVLTQRSYCNWELIMVNDGSDDGDVGIAGRLCAAHGGKIRLYEHEGRARRGISASRNLGIRCSDGPLVAFLDADDTWYPHKLQSQVRLLDLHPEADMVYGAALRWWSWSGGEDIHVPAAVDGFGSDCLVPGSALLETFLRDESLTPCTGSVLIRRSVLDKVGGFEEEFPGLYDDQVLYAKICQSAQVFVSSDCVSRYRKHSDSCCGQAECSGQAKIERAKFLKWLRCYRERLQFEASGVALSSH